MAVYMQAFLAAATIMGVCMSILLGSPYRVGEDTVGGWNDWGRMVNAIRMAFLFIAESALLLFFFLAPVLEVVGSHQALVVRRLIRTKAGAA